MSPRVFPVVIAEQVVTTSLFYEALGFERHFPFPTEGEPGDVGLRRGESEVSVVAARWPQQQDGLTPGHGVRLEMFVYVDDVDAAVAQLRDTSRSEVLSEPADMPWGERVGDVADPDGNPVALAAPGAARAA